MNMSVNFENIVAVYVNKNPHLYSMVDDDFFKNPSIRIFFKLSKQFYERFKEQIYDPNRPSIGQIEALVLEDKKEFQLDNNVDEDTNARNFLSNIKYVLETDIRGYSEEWLEKTIGSWITWQNNQKGYRCAIQYMQTENITPENVAEVINKAKDIVIRRSNVLINDEEVMDFFDPKAHKQVAIDDYVDSGYATINKFVCGFDNGGFCPKTLNMFIGPSNSGKSVILGNIAKNIAFSGKNVLFVSLEMEIAKTYRRIGSDVFDIPIGEYDRFSADEEVISAAIREKKQQSMQNTGVPVGRFIGIKFTKATPEKIKGSVLKLEEKLGIKFHAVVIDYFTELGSDYGISQESMYIYHKMNAQSLFQIAGDLSTTLITAHQCKISNYVKGDIDLSSLGESSGIIHPCDSIIGMISSDQMQIEKQMYFKALKVREGKYKNHYARYTTDFNKMRIIEASDLIEPESYNVYTA